MQKSHFNIDWVKKNITSKDQFKKEFDAHSDNVDLDAEYDKIFPASDEKKPAKKAESNS